MQCFQQSSNDVDSAKPLELETVCVKEELNSESEDWHYGTDIELLSEEGAGPELPRDVVVNVDITCLTTGNVKEEPAVFDGHFSDTQNNPVNEDIVKLEVHVIKENCSSPTPEDLVVEDDEIDEGPHHACKICLKIFNCKSSLTNHMLIHEDKKNKTIQRSEEQNITCKTCGLKFPSLSTYLKHRHMHLLEKPFTCEICKKDFRTKYLLSNHERVHTGERPYSCKLCDKKFTEQVNLKRHERIHSGHKPYFCNVCKKKFALKHNLTLHMRSHTKEKPFKCDICNKEFPHKPYLVRHQMVHTGEKRFSCDICKKSYTRKYYLNDHIRVHNNEKPYACDICDKRFVSKYDCNKHLKVHMRKRKKLDI